MYRFTTSPSIGTGRQFFQTKPQSVTLPVKMGRESMQQPDDSTILAVQTGELSHVLIGHSGLSLQKVCVLSGSFNPLHEGHMKMAEIAVARTGRELVYELCLQNVDKPALTIESARQRIRQPFAPHSVVLTGSPTFEEKSKLFDGATFVVGADTIQRIADPAYYNNDLGKRDLAINVIRDAGCRFLVFGRSIHDSKADSFRTLSEMSLPQSLVAICDEVSRSEFDCGVSSTEIRNRHDSPNAE